MNSTFGLAADLSAARVIELQTSAVTPKPNDRKKPLRSTL